MERLFERHDMYLSDVPMDYIRSFMNHINWDSRLIMIKALKVLENQHFYNNILRRILMPMTDMYYIALPIQTILQPTL